MDLQGIHAADPVRTALQGYLEVLYLALDRGSVWLSSDLHAAFEWAVLLHKVIMQPEMPQKLQNLAQELSHVLPHAITSCLDAALQAPTQLLLRSLLLRTAPTSRPDWNLKVLAAHTSACTLPEPHLTSDVYTAIRSIRERERCLSLGRIASTQPPSPSTALTLAAASAPSWLPSPNTLALEHLTYFSSPSALDTATAAIVLLNNYKTTHNTIVNVEGNETSVRGGELPAASLRAEVFARALCLLPAREQQEEPRGTSPPRKLAPHPLVTDFCVMLRSTPQLAVEIPPPLAAQACRSSFAVATEYSAALKVLQERCAVPVVVLLTCLKHLCLFDDHTAQYFRNDLEGAYALM